MATSKIIPLTIIAGLVALLWPKKPDVEQQIASLQKEIAKAEGDTTPASQVGTKNDPDADAHAQMIYTSLAEKLGDTPLAANGMSAAELANVHALVPTPEQQKAGDVPLASNYYDNGPITLPGNTDYETVMSYVWDRYHVSLRGPVVPPPEATPLANQRTGQIYGWQTPWTSSGFLVLVDTALVPALEADWDPRDQGTHQSGPGRWQPETSGDVNQESEWSEEY
jgi:hypothetical protein